MIGTSYNGVGRLVASLWERYPLIAVALATFGVFVAIQQVREHIRDEREAKREREAQGLNPVRTRLGFKIVGVLLLALFVSGIVWGK